MWYRLHGRHAQQAQVPWIEKTHVVLPHSWLEKPRFAMANSSGKAPWRRRVLSTCRAQH